MRTGRGTWNRKKNGKEKETEKAPSYFEPWQQVPGLERQGKGNLAVEITNYECEWESQKASARAILLLGALQEG